MRVQSPFDRVLEFDPSEADLFHHIQPVRHITDTLTDPVRQ